MHILTKLSVTLAAGLALAACSDPAPTPTPDPPEPQTAAAEEHTELRDAMQAPLEKAQSVEVTLQESAAARDDALEAADD
ncbi:hypothetical protein [Arenimonas donghaensis]|uniref:Uncharacterized protein n=1 Tax=Arenimonas donghaensis DSM 18148 = HO3-R19 TaxID=1121014 RepID=A0A087MKU9_9GAMM|nr:hypothetical protein [Arenimonas donghaensis]KFL37502.1 hypothetical protein N788_08945 [Arenimonas donghaensis DSM 18148 = HO3-R19]